MGGNFISERSSAVALSSTAAADTLQYASLGGASLAPTVVSGDGEHHDATATTWNFCCRDDRTRDLRLHLHAETKKKVTNGNLTASGARTLARLFCSGSFVNNRYAAGRPITAPFSKPSL